MILSSIEHFAHSNLGHVAGAVIANGFAYGIDGAIAGVALGILGGAAINCIASRGDRSGASGLFLVAGAIWGAKYGAALGTIYGLGTGILSQVV